MVTPLRWWGMSVSGLPGGLTDYSWRARPLRGLEGEVHYLAHEAVYDEVREALGVGEA